MQLAFRLLSASCGESDSSLTETVAGVLTRGVGRVATAIGVFAVEPGAGPCDPATVRAALWLGGLAVAGLGTLLLVAALWAVPALCVRLARDASPEVSEPGTALVREPE